MFGGQRFKGSADRLIGRDAARNDKGGEGLVLRYVTPAKAGVSHLRCIALPGLIPAWAGMPGQYRRYRAVMQAVDHAC